MCRLYIKLNELPTGRLGSLDVLANLVDAQSCCPIEQVQSTRIDLYIDLVAKRRNRSIRIPHLPFPAVHGECQQRLAAEWLRDDDP